MAVQMNPYFGPILAVAGTLLGAVVTQVAAGRRENRALEQQREALERQQQHGSLEAIRRERRRVYSGFYDAMERWNVLVLDVSAAVKSVSDGEGGSAADDVAQLRAGYAKRQDRLWREWRSLDSQLQLLAGRRLQDAARDIFNLYMMDMQDAWNGKDPWARAARRRVFPSTIQFLMKEEIGVVGGREIDPATGFWRQDGEGPGRTESNVPDENGEATDASAP